MLGTNKPPRAGHNTSGLTVLDSFWVIQRDTQPAFPRSLLFKSEERNTQSEGDSGDLCIGSLNTHTHTHRQENLHSNTQIVREKQVISKGKQTNTHHTHIEGAQGIHSGPARLQTSAQWAEGAGQGKKEVEHE